MGESNFTERELEGRSEDYVRMVQGIRARFGFDFVSIGLTPYRGAPLKWVYSDGATSERHRRISLAPGHGIGGIVLRTGKPMMFLDIDKDIDPRDYSSYPIVFAEDLRSFCALPLLKGGRTVAVLLCAFRSVETSHREAFLELIAFLDGSLGDLRVVSDDFLVPDDFRGDYASSAGEAAGETVISSSSVSLFIEGQENERKRISRELHDGVAQELLGVSFSVRSLKGHVDAEGEGSLRDAIVGIDHILGELHDIAVTLRPSTLDNLGLLPALRSQAQLMKNSYGVEVAIDGALVHERFNPACETQVYRICQEAMLNACKYSGVDTVRVGIEETSGWIKATIEDHGKGFDTDKPLIRGSGCGLSGMRERAGLIGGTLTTESGPEGTTVTLVAPMRTFGEGA